ncbi:bacterioferritin-associated ferredoxin [Catenovulum sp. SM1970]|uniref:bacterioferritin-associated ferredoxin n=1 Tax=Marinifaba aquimaris TaxID=2741323 RepID=UPI0015740E46|nr:bacterioferritin-associated ferredoxin [Marinifaba aquimaris]NTS77861.1 bacterioferritin-associated ferredoxin [Marinifaba aquimaris]
MYICLCNGVTDKQIKEAVQSGCTDLSSIKDKMAVGNQCGKCTKNARKVIRQEIEQDANLIAKFS